MKAYMSLIADPTKYINFADYADPTQMELVDGFQWAYGALPEGASVYHAVDPMAAISELIIEGMTVLAEDPLPIDIEKEILQLEVFVKQYYAYGRINLIRDTVINFNISEERQDVSSDQRDVITGLKNQLLDLFPDA